MGEKLQSIGLEPRIVVMQALSFVVLYVVLRKFLFAPIGNMIESRNREVADRLDKAERDEKAMEAVRTEYERRIAESETEARDRIQAAMTEAHRIAEEIKDRARRESEEIRARGLAQIQQEKEKAVKEIQDQVVDLAVSAAQAAVRKTCDERANRELIGAFVREVESGVS